MYDDNQDALAAEYVLGTLSAEERSQAEVLLSADRGFAAAVRQWERRLGELNVMVEAIEPPPEVWNKIKSKIGPAAAGDQIELSPRVEEPQPAMPPAAALEAGLSPSADIEPETVTAATAPAELVSEPPLPRPETKQIERSADVIYLVRRVTHWRRVALSTGVLAALFALYIAVWQVAPDRIPPPLRPSAARMMTRTPAPGEPQGRLVAVLQQEPMAPAFLLTLDTQNRKLIVRTVSARPEAGRSYELWLISSEFPRPHSLGIVGDGEFTQRALPANYDVNMLRTARYAVSLEPAGGSPSGVPTGPILFTGNAVESLPGSPPRG